MKSACLLEQSRPPHIRCSSSLAALVHEQINEASGLIGWNYINKRYWKAPRCFDCFKPHYQQLSRHIYWLHPYSCWFFILKSHADSSPSTLRPGLGGFPQLPCPEGAILREAQRARALVLSPKMAILIAEMQIEIANMVIKARKRLICRHEKNWDSRNQRNRPHYLFL